METKILGIDPALHRTGWALLSLKEGKIKEIEVGFFDSSGKSALQRLASLHLWMEQFLVEKNPTEMVIETQYVDRNVQSAFSIAMVRGIFIALAVRKELLVEECTPSEAKKAITGNGRATKEQVQKMASLLFKLDPSSLFDMTDALAIALCHYHRRQK